jgi:GT2 family glycosyltransferase
VEHATPPILDDVTLVIPTLGRPMLGGCLESIARGTVWSARLLIIDQGTNEHTDAMVAEYTERGMVIDHHRSPKRGTAAAMNTAIELVETSFIAVTHDDCEVNAEWLERIAARLRSEPGSIITGQVRPEGDEVVPGTITETAPMRFERPIIDRDPLFPDNMAFARAIADRLGAFDEDERLRFAEDAEWSYRALRGGVPIVYDPELVVTHLAWRDAAQRVVTYQRYSASQGGFYGKYLRRGDWYIGLRVGYDLLRGSWMWLRGTIERNGDLRAYGRAYLTYLPPGIVAGLRNSP